MSLRCNICERALVPHCREPKEPTEASCAWWTCSNANCDASTYDVERGILVHKGGLVERLGMG